MGVSREKVVLVLGALAFQLHILSMAMSNYRTTTAPGGSTKSRDDAIQAFLIMAYLLVLAAFVLLLLQNFSDLKGKLIEIVTIFLLMAEAACVLVGLAIYGDFYRAGTTGSAFSITVYSIGGLSGLAAGVCLCAKVFCGK